MTVADHQSETVSAVSGSAGSQPGTTSKWPRYLDATVGFTNHWHPAIFGHELAEGSFVSVKVLGRQILLTRVDGAVRAIADQCAHRGVRFSAEPLCFQKGTVSCWYHGWTYSLDDGRLVDVLTSPNSPVIGQIGVPVFAAREDKGLVFVFIGEGQPHDLAEDVPPGFLDPHTHCLGIRRTVRSNWRLGVENGFDTTHIFMHRNSPLIKGNNLALPFGFVPADRGAMDVHAEGWPKGVVDNLAQNYRPVFEAQLNGQSVLQCELSGDEKRVAAQVSVWLPGVLKVEPFPDPTLIQYEFYVPINETEHEYFQVLQRKVESDTDIAAFAQEFDSKWCELALHGFNDSDVWAREAQEEFYRNKNGWNNEHLFPPDMCITKWRQLASTHARGIQHLEDPNK